jgi:hypothetical protein
MRSYLPTPIAIGLIVAFTALVVIGACLFTLGGVR